MGGGRDHEGAALYKRVGEKYIRVGGYKNPSKERQRLASVLVGQLENHQTFPEYRDATGNDGNIGRALWMSGNPRLIDGLGRLKAMADVQNGNRDADSFPTPDRSETPTGDTQNDTLYYNQEKYDKAQEILNDIEQTFGVNLDFARARIKNTDSSFGSGSNVNSKFESLDEERGMNFPKINTERQMSVRPSYPITDRQLSYRETLSNSQRATLDAMERRMQTGRYTPNDFKDEIVDIAKSLGVNTKGMSAGNLTIDINNLLGSRL